MSKKYTQMEVLDLMINVLKEHEKVLSDQTAKLDEIVNKILNSSEKIKEKRQQGDKVFNRKCPLAFQKMWEFYKHCEKLFGEGY